MWLKQRRPRCFRATNYVQTTARTRCPNADVAATGLEDQISPGNAGTECLDISGAIGLVVGHGNAAGIRRPANHKMPRIPHGYHWGISIVRCSYLKFAKRHRRTDADVAIRRDSEDISNAGAPKSRHISTRIPHPIIG